jgi:uncharacterized membrane protein YbhN (UPF0104 family)
VAAKAQAVNPRRIPWLALVALGLLAIAAAGVLRLPAVQQQALLTALRSFVLWLPVLYGVVALSYAGRYWRWRFLLRRLGIGRSNWPDLLGWFRGFALTAIPAKVGELSRVAGVALLLLVLTPAQVLGRLPSATSPLLMGVVLVVLIAALLVRSPAPRRWLQTHRQHWRHQLPSGVLTRATVPAALISVLVWANEALVLWLLVGLLAPAPITITAAIAIYLLSGTAGMASSLPGGIGVNEDATELLLAQQGVPAAVAQPIAVLRRLITLWSISLFAAAASARHQ